jgi:hypothetical protein
MNNGSCGSVRRRQPAADTCFANRVDVFPCSAPSFRASCFASLAGRQQPRLLARSHGERQFGKAQPTLVTICLWYLHLL